MVTKLDPTTYTSELSDLNVPPGMTPDSIALPDIGNGKPFRLHMYHLEGKEIRSIEYRQPGTWNVLIVFND